MFGNKQRRLIERLTDEVLAFRIAEPGKNERLRQWKADNAALNKALYDEMTTVKYQGQRLREYNQVAFNLLAAWSSFKVQRSGELLPAEVSVDTFMARLKAVYDAPSTSGAKSGPEEKADD